MQPRPYGPFPYSPIIDRPRLAWPGGAHVALWIIPNIEFFALDEKVPAGSGGSGAPVPDVPTWSVRDYGNRVGVFRLMDALDRYDIRATVALNSDLCAQHPVIIEEGRKRRWEWMGHNESNTRRLNELRPGEEPRVIASALAQSSDILLLDEPTNHLDIDAVEWMETFLIDRGITLVFVTHDRAFLRGFAERVIEVRDGHARVFAGDYDDYLRRVAL